MGHPFFSLDKSIIDALYNFDFTHVKDDVKSSREVTLLTGGPVDGTESLSMSSQGTGTMFGSWEGMETRGNMELTAWSENGQCPIMELGRDSRRTSPRKDMI